MSFQFHLQGALKPRSRLTLKSRIKYRSWLVRHRYRRHCSVKNGWLGLRTEQLAPKSQLCVFFESWEKRPSRTSTTTSKCMISFKTTLELVIPHETPCSAQWHRHRSISGCERSMERRWRVRTGYHQRYQSGADWEGDRERVRGCKLAGIASLVESSGQLGQGCTVRTSKQQRSPGRSSW